MAGGEWDGVQGAYGDWDGVSEERDFIGFVQPDLADGGVRQMDAENGLVWELDGHRRKWVRVAGPGATAYTDRRGRAWVNDGIEWRRRAAHD
jgi:hypothetical protein